MNEDLARCERNALVESHARIVERVARCLLSRLSPSADADALLGAGIVGLVDAADRFDEARGLPFSVYAEIRVRGAMLDHLAATNGVEPMSSAALNDATLRALRRLDERQRIVLSLYYFDRRGPGVVGALTGASEDRLHHFRRAAMPLLQMLAPERAPPP